MSYILTFYAAVPKPFPVGPHNPIRYVPICSIFNMFLVVAQGDEVLGIFYDCLALQFLQILDNMAFSVAKMGVFGRHLKWATSKKIFLMEFDKPPYSGRKAQTLCVKLLYIFNLAVMFALLLYVNYQQITGQLTCPSITVTFPNVSLLKLLRQVIFTPNLSFHFI